MHIAAFGTLGSPAAFAARSMNDRSGMERLSRRNARTGKTRDEVVIAFNWLNVRSGSPVL